MDACKATLGNVLSVPEQLYGAAFLQLSHQELGVTLEFTARDALWQWRQDGAPAVRVGVADAWMSSRQREVASSGAVAMQYDWWAPETGGNGSAPALLRTCSSTASQPCHKCGTDAWWASVQDIHHNIHGHITRIQR